MEHSVSIEPSVRKGLGIIFERVRRRFRPRVVHMKGLVFFHEDKLHVGSGAFDRSRLYVTGYS